MSSSLCQCALATKLILDSDVHLRRKTCYDPFASVKRAHETYKAPECCHLEKTARMLLPKDPLAHSCTWSGCKDVDGFRKETQNTVDIWIHGMSSIWDALHLELTSNCCARWNPTWQVPEVDQHRKITAQTQRENKAEGAHAASKSRVGKALQQPAELMYNWTTLFDSNWTHSLVWEELRVLSISSEEIHNSFDIQSKAVLVINQGVTSTGCRCSS